MPRVLHVLSQRPLLTGSGVTLDALVRRAARAGWTQSVVAAQPADEPVPELGGIEADQFHPLTFGGSELPFPIPGMSDVMPYATRRYSQMSEAEVTQYEDAWLQHLDGVRARFAPDLVHAHHLWLLGARLRDVFPAIPIVSHCHGTGLRQMQLCPHLAERVRRGCARNDAFAVLHGAQQREVGAALGVADSRLAVVGAGYREEVFHAREPGPRGRQDVVYAGKLSESKGLPWLLDAVQAISERRQIRLHVAGAGAGAEAEALRRRMLQMDPLVEMHGQLDQEALAALLRRASVFALPSMYEGLPLVLIEAAACGCRLVCTDLPGLRGELLPAVRSVLEVVPLPRLVGADQPRAEDLPQFVDHLAGAIERSLDAGSVPPGSIADGLSSFTWDAVFERVQKVWRQLLD